MAESFQLDTSGAVTIHVVLGTTGEYSDRCEWLVKAFRDEASARAFVERLTVERQKLGYPAGNWDAWEEIAAAMRLHDPSFSEDYTGTSWFVCSCPLSEAGQVELTEGAR